MFIPVHLEVIDRHVEAIYYRAEHYFCNSANAHVEDNDQKICDLASNPDMGIMLPWNWNT